MERDEGEKIELTLAETDALAKMLAKRDNVKSILAGLNSLGQWVTDLFREVEDGFFVPLAQRLDVKKEEHYFDVNDEKLEIRLMKRDTEDEAVKKAALFARIREAVGSEVDVVDASGLTSEQVEAAVAELKRNDA